MDIIGLEQRVRDAYYAYVDGRPIMTDYQYNQLEEELRQANPEASIFKEMAELADIKPTGSYDELLISNPMRSIKSIYKLSTIANWLDSIPEDEPLLATLKEDGAASTIRYSYGHFKQAKSRGRTTEGNDISKHLQHVVPSYVEEFKDIRLVDIRGEILIPDALFEQLQEDFPTTEYNNARNSIASILAPSSPEEMAKYLKFIAYNIYTTDDAGEDIASNLDKLSKKLNLLKSIGFNIPPKMLFKFSDNPELSRQDILEAVVEKFAIEVKDKVGNLSDGVVIAIDDVEEFMLRGLSGEYNEGHKALKIGAWASKKYMSEVVEIEWTYGVQFCTPTAIVKPVQTDSGREVRRVHLKTVDIMHRAKAYPGNMIEFEYVSDQIPKLLINGRAVNE